MLIYFVPDENVIHPETGEVLFEAGGLYGQECLIDAAEQFGMDNIQGRIILGKTEDDIIRVFENT